MFNQFVISDRGYNATNAYLTMLASHFIFPDHFHPSARLPNRTQNQQTLRESIYQTSATAFFIKHGFKQVAHINLPHVGVNALVLSNNDYAMLVYRGTEWAKTELFLKKDMAGNLDVEQIAGGVNFGGNRARIHSGLAKAIKAAHLPIVTALKKAGITANSTKPLVVTGHSLGGASATLSALGLHNKNLNVHCVYSHAGYMVGDEGFGEAYVRAKIPYHRVVNKDDLVPEFPQIAIEIAAAVLPLNGESPLLNALNRAIPLVPSSVKTAYCHVPGTLAYINHNDHIRLNPDYLEMRSARRPGLNTSHHATGLYKLALFKACPTAIKKLGVIPDIV